jgi:UDP-glucose 4-epimerase
MRVLITGASGQVGGAIARELVGKGWEVVGISRTLSKVFGLTQQLQLDISSIDFVAQVCAAVPDCHAIVHAAASLDTDAGADSISLVNCFGTHNVLKLAYLWKVNSFIYLSSVGVIGRPQVLPITEDHPIQPLTAYHAAKLYGEHLTQIVGRTGLPGAMLRLSSPVSPQMPGNRILSVYIVQALLNQPLSVFGTGMRRQNYVDVRDIAAAVALCLEQQVQGLFNIGGRRAISNRELAQLCIQVLGSKSAITYGGQPDEDDTIAWDLAIEKAAEHFGYCPQYDLGDSIKTIGEMYAAGYHQ